MGIEFSKLKKHTEFVLAYEFGEDDFQIIPTVQDRTKLLDLLAKQQKDKTDDLSGIINFHIDLFLRDSDPTDSERVIVRDFVEANVDKLIDKTLIGFRITTKEDMDKQKQQIQDKLVEKNLM